MDVLINIIIVVLLIIGLALAPIIIKKYFSNISEEKRKLTTKQLMYIVNLTALATVVGAIEIPLGTIIPGGKLDFSEVIVLIALMVIGFKNTLVVIFLRSFIRFVIIPSELEFIMKLLGEGIAIIASLIFVIAYCLMSLILKKKTKPLMYEIEIEPKKVSFIEYILYPLFITSSLIVVLFLFHYFITVPIYSNLFGQQVSGFKAKFIVILPFTLLNLIKGVLSTIIFLFARNQIQKVIK